MGYKALVTLDLPFATGKQRDDFYESLKKNNWYKIPSLTTAWYVSFLDGATRDSAIMVLKNHLNEAKNYSRAQKVEYALQLDLNDVVILTIQ